MINVDVEQDPRLYSQASNLSHFPRSASHPREAKGLLLGCICIDPVPGAALTIGSSRRLRTNRAYQGTYTCQHIRSIVHWKLLFRQIQGRGFVLWL